MGLLKRGKPKAKQGAVESAMEEVHKNIPSTVPEWVRRNPKKKEAMLRAIAFSKARKGK